jgi:hypothetical protein
MSGYTLVLDKDSSLRELVIKLNGGYLHNKEYEGEIKQYVGKLRVASYRDSKELEVEIPEDLIWEVLYRINDVIAAVVKRESQALAELSPVVKATKKEDN